MKSFVSGHFTVSFNRMSIFDMLIDPVKSFSHYVNKKVQFVWYYSSFNVFVAANQLYRKAVSDLFI